MASVNPKIAGGIKQVLDHFGDMPDGQFRGNTFTRKGEKPTPAIPGIGSLPAAPLKPSRYPPPFDAEGVYKGDAEGEPMRFTEVTTTIDTSALDAMDLREEISRRARDAMALDMDRKFKAFLDEQDREDAQLKHEVEMEVLDEEGFGAW